VKALRKSLAAGVEAIAECVEFILAHAARSRACAFAGAVPFLKLVGSLRRLADGASCARAEAKLAAQRATRSSTTRRSPPRVLRDHVLSQAKACAIASSTGPGTVMALDEEQFLAA
jgi:hypothetical protein